ncbi:AraC family transcriptional regulator [Actinocorallia sp. API 0066]|uniref:AraC family transcriptional regulator n=1 Tax=Actinocorallia sp. API 0066 TaxID=2896846 RepID=UPI001E44042F|nr:AraC family transcriptional regulator [Actinocorallia sp. API 0066]MCD0449267.1 AraC family transcriptional regulator [Actinocorallia sp. API 0066]
MDPLAALLDGPRARGAFLLRSVMDPPWSMRVQDRAPLTVVVIVRGHAWISPETGPPVRLAAGEVALARGPHAYTVSDAPETPARIVIHPGQVCTSLDGTRLAERMSQGVRTWGNSRDGATVMLTGTYETATETTQDLLNALPPLLTLPADASREPLVAALTEEITSDSPGQPAILDRLLDLLTITLLRAWLTRPDARPPAWYRARADPLVGPALRLLHHNPAHPWTVDLLAAELAVSRSTLTRRFTSLVGEPPMAHLTRHRLSLAADLLEDPALTLDTIARRVGYASPFALSTAFKRTRGLTPAQHRAKVR